MSKGRAGGLSDKGFSRNLLGRQCGSMGFNKSPMEAKKPLKPIRDPEGEGADEGKTCYFHLPKEDPKWLPGQQDEDENKLLAQSCLFFIHEQYIKK